MSRDIVLVTGATGYIGGRLVPRLLDAGYRVGCLARSPQKLDGREWTRHPRRHSQSCGVPIVDGPCDRSTGGNDRRTMITFFL